MPPSTSVRPWTQEEIRDFGYRVVDIIAGHLTELPDRPVVRPFPADTLDRAMPEDGSPAGDVLSEFAAQIEPYPFGNGHPRFWGWVNSPPTPIGIFAEALAAAMNPSCAGGNHAAIYVERQVIAWFRDLFGFPQDSMGLLVSGGSMASLTALAVARYTKAGFDVRTQGLQQPHAPMVIYQTREGHGCLQKSAEMLGLGSSCLRIVEHDSALRMIPAALDAAITADRDAGRIPLAVAASAGSVNTGAIDPLAEIADICAHHNVWLHADGAYGAPAMLTARYRDQLAALSRCDSVALDPHKWLYVPVEAGLVLIRDGAAMRAAFSLVPPYLRTSGGMPWLSEYGFQQTRGFRALKVWMALKHHGFSGYRAAIEHDLAMADALAARIAEFPDLQCFTPRSLSIVCFRYAPPASHADLNAINRAILERLQLGGECFLSGTEIDGVFWLRACIVNYRTTEADIAMLPDLVMRLAAEAL